MELVIKSTGDRTTIEIDGEEIKNATMVNFIAAVHSGTQCVFEQIVTDEWGHVMLNESRDEILREIHRIDLTRGEIV